MKTISTWLLFGLLSFTALRSWFDYLFSLQMPAQVRSIHRGRAGKLRTREFDFGICRYTVIDRDPYLEKLFALVGARAPELDDVAEGDRVMLQVSGATGHATPVPRMPIVTTIVPLLFLALCLAGRRPPSTKPRPQTVVRSCSDGSTEVRLERHRCLGCTFLETLLVLGAFGSLLLMGYGLAAPFLEGEPTLREGTAFVMVVLLLAPLIAVIRRLAPVPSVRWNESTVWIHGMKFRRAEIRRIILDKGALVIHGSGSRGKRCFAQESSWIGAQLERLGYVVEIPAPARAREVG